MSRLLHISDLHLGQISDQDVPDDNKSEIVPLKDRESRTTFLKNTLRQLATKLQENNETLDAVIVTGDITCCNRTDGFSTFEEILDCLGAARPSPERIVVVPGNHDVEWGAIDARVRYEYFIHYIRDRGFVTPFLDEIDSTGSFSESASPSRHVLISGDKRWAIIPINSSHYCGSMEGINGLSESLWTKLPRVISAAFPSEAHEPDVRALLRSLRMKDVARISPSQLQAIKDLSTYVRSTSKTGSPPILIAALHHHLLPVSTREEVKPYESITNLGRLRNTLRENGVSVVLHGHKHAASVYYDYIPDLSHSDPEEHHRILVVSAPNVMPPGSHPVTLCQLLAIGSQALAPTLTIVGVPSVEIGATLTLGQSRQYLLWQESHSHLRDATRVQLIEGTSIDSVYDRVRTLFEKVGSSELLSNLICRISHVPSIPYLPASYPEIPDISESERHDWFKKIVSWWQKQDFIRLSGEDHFNHGIRIFRYARDTNQLQSVIDAIRTQPLTSRGVITLLKPHEKDLAPESKFPSFCFVQFVVRRHNGGYVLDVVALFRKQEMQYWWPINIAELALLQDKIFNAVAVSVNSALRSILTKGSITTLSTLAHFGEDVPFILVPAVDLDLEENPQKLWDMTYAICWREIAGSDIHRQTWEHVIKNLIPPPEPGALEITVPVRGIEYLAELSEHFGRNHNGVIIRIASEWKTLERLNRNFLISREQISREALSKTDRSDKLDRIYKDWRSEVMGTLNNIREIVNQRFDSSIAVFP